MKKILFSAVALTAFSFSSMANNEVKEDKELTKETVEVKVEKQEDKNGEYTCFDYANDAEADLLSDFPYVSDETLNSFWLDSYGHCCCG